MNIKKTIIVCDIAEDKLTSLELSILFYIISFLKRHYQLNIVSKIFLDESDINELKNKTLTALQNDKYNMRTSFQEVLDILDKEKILYYSINSNPALAEKIKNTKMDDMLSCLWEEYEKHFFSENTIRFEDEMYQIAQEIALENKANVIEIFFNNKLIFWDIHTRFHPNYPLIGRGFYALGATHRIISKRVKKTDYYRIYIPLSITEGLYEYDRINYFIEIINHEIFGHIENNLHDHCKIESNDSCLMTVESSFRELLYKAQKKQGIYLCTECLNKVNENQRRLKGVECNV